MANIKLIKRRINSAKNISQITRAMQLVAASKMKKAQERAVKGKPYAEKIYTAVKELAARTDQSLHPLLRRDYLLGRKLIILISTNKGLCGGLNTNLFRAMLNWFNDKENYDYITLGKKGENFLVKTGCNLIADFSQKIPFTENITALTSLIIEGFINNKYKEVYVVYNNFVSALKQTPQNKLILPLGKFTDEELAREASTFQEFLIEPSIPEVLNALLPYYVENQIRAAILEAEAAEHSARMISMKNATDSAYDLTLELTLEYNRARQEKITYEIADMVTARMAVE